MYLLRRSLWILALLVGSHCFSAYFLWDASRENMSGNADWVIDANGNSGQPPESDPDRYPSPSQSGVTGSTPENYWRGMNSEWAIRLVKAGHHVETLPRGMTITYGTGASQDLSNYNVFILNEPQNPLSHAEQQAVYDFIENGGGVFMIADHCGSDRNHNGWDSPRVFNDMDIQTQFGVVFYDDSMTHDCDFSSNIFRVNDSPDDPIIHGPFGAVQNIKYNGTTEIEIFPSTNPSLSGHAWRNPGSQGSNRYMVVTCNYGSGKVAFVPDSSPTSDGSGDPGDTSYGNTFSHPDYDNDHLFLNVSVWLADGTSLPPTPTPTNPATPTVTPTPVNLNGVDLRLNKLLFNTGDFFQFKSICGNQEDSAVYDLYVALEISGVFWFYPSWGQTPDSESIFMSQGSSIEKTIFNFIWPDVQGSASGLKFWGALLTPGGELLGNYDVIEWGYE